MIAYSCPVCGYRKLTAKPYEDWPPPPGVELHPPYENQLGRPSYEVCPGCGFEFGNDDNPGTAAPTSFEQYREDWLYSGARRSPLRGTAETMTSGRSAGEWDLELGPTDAPLSELVAAFTSAFRWASFRTFECGPSARRYAWPSAQPAPLDAWLRATADDLGSFRATLDLALFWEDEDVHEAVLPDAATIWFERESEGMMLTIWPNLFTNLLPLYEPEGTHGIRSRAVDWPRAAQRNRERLAASLRAWETASGGQLVAWGSELVEGVERYGFRADSTSRDAEAALRRERGAAPPVLRGTQ